MQYNIPLPSNRGSCTWTQGEYKLTGTRITWGSGTEETVSVLPLGAIRFSKASPVGVLCPTRTHLLALIPLFRRFHTLNVAWEVSYREGFANNELLPSTKDSLRYLVCHKTGKETVSKTSYTSKNSLPCKQFNLLPVRSVKNKKKIVGVSLHCSIHFMVFFC